MELNIKKSKPEKQPVSKYIINVQTMEGDADGYNAFNLTFDERNIEEVKKVIIYCEVLKRQYPNGRGGRDDYKLDFFDEYFNDNWNYEYDGQIQDSMEGYDVYYYDENSVKYNVSVLLAPEDKLKIESYGVLR